MSIFRYIKQNCRVDSGYLITDHEFDALRKEFITIRWRARSLSRDYWWYAKRDGWWRATNTAYHNLMKCFSARKQR